MPAGSDETTSPSSVQPAPRRGPPLALLAALVLLTTAGACGGGRSDGQPPSSEDNLLAGRKPIEVVGVRDAFRITDGVVGRTGGQWNSPGTAWFEREGSVTWDLGAQRHVTGGYVQADNNDRFRVQGSADDKTWTELWAVGEVDHSGLRVRARKDLDATVRYVRVEPIHGDHRTTLAELQLYGDVLPAWPVELPRYVPECRQSGHPPDRAPQPGTTIERLAHPPTAVATLLDLDGRVQGEPPDLAAPIASYGAEELAGWKKDELYHSPQFGDELEEAAQLVITVQAGQAEALQVAPLTQDSARRQRRERLHRLIKLPLEPDEQGRAVLTLDIAEHLRANWNDLDPTLKQLELDFTGDDISGAVVEELDVFDARFRYPDAAGRTEVDIDGLIRPSWYVHAGSTVSFDLSLPPDPSLLRMHLAGTQARVKPTVTVVADGQETALELPEKIANWPFVKLPLDAWAGKKITLRLGAAGRGVAFFGAPEVIQPQPSQTPDVIVYLADTLNAPRLGAWGSPLADQDISPSIDRMVDEGVAFGWAISSGPWTKPVVTSLMTGVAGATHMVGSRTHTDALPEAVAVLQEHFGDAGYRTGAFVANPHGSTLSGLERGFDVAASPRYWRPHVGKLGQPSASQLQQSALDFLDEEDGRPAFVYVHTLEPHEYLRTIFQTTDDGWQPYDKAIQAQDEALGELMEQLRQRDRDAILIFLSDHGEAFEEHDQNGHGMSVYQEEVHVPLVFWSPDRLSPATINTPVSLLDLPATLVDLAGLDPLPMAQGHSLLPLMEGVPDVEPRTVYSSREWYIWDARGPRYFAAVTPDMHKAILRDKGKPELYDLAADPCERDPLEWTGPAVTAVQQWRRDQAQAEQDFAERYGRSETRELSTEEIEQLKSLGYLQ